jgi:hypothetical protein
MARPALGRFSGAVCPNLGDVADVRSILRKKNHHAFVDALVLIVFRGATPVPL